MIHVDAVWLATQPLDMRAGSDTVMLRVVRVFGAAHPHHAYVFANRRCNRLKVLVHDGIGVWLAARRLQRGHFIWTTAVAAAVPIDAAQLSALVLGLPWAKVGSAGIITSI